MTDENWELNKKFGRKINTEKDGYTEVEEDGIARPVLKIPRDIPKGRRRLTAVYTDEYEKIYRASLARTMVIYGSKLWIHCPTIYHPIDKKDITFTANLFSNNRPVPGGNSKFKYMSKTVSPNKLPVSNGYVEETHVMKPKNGSRYSCNYEGSEKYNISEGEAEGLIIVFKDYKTPLVVEVVRLIMNVGETSKLVARVYHRDHQNLVNIPEDAPTSGTITFYIDEEKYGNPVPISSNAIATIDYTATHPIGVHLITAVYEPDTEEMKEKYQKTSGANTLFIGDDQNRPKLTQVGKNCGLSYHEHVLEFNSNRTLNGKIRIYMDGIPIYANETTENGTITFLGSKSVLYEQTVENKTNFKFTFEIPYRVSTNPSDIWGYPGYHNMIIQYIEPNEELGDMEYWYFWDDFYIQVETIISILGETDTTDDEGTFTGNNMYIHKDGSTIHYKPSLEEIPRSYVVGSKLYVKVTDKSYVNTIKEGSVKVTVNTRKKERWVS